MKISRRFTQADQDVYSTFEWSSRTSRISNPDGSVVFEMTDAQIPAQWSQLATDIMVSKYFRKAGIPVLDASGKPTLDEAGKPITTGEKSAKQVVHRLAGCWRHWGETHGYFDSAEDAQAFYDELAYMMLDQACAPNSPQWFNTGLHFAYNISGPAQGHFFCDPTTGELKESENAYEHPQPHACFIQSVADDLVNPGGIMDLWTREARLFKYGSGTGSNFSNVRGDNETLSAAAAASVGPDVVPQDRRPCRRRDQVGRHHPPRREDGAASIWITRMSKTSSTGRCAKSSKSPPWSKG